MEVARMGIIPASEVPDGQTARRIVEDLTNEVVKPRVLLWLRARNQNHQIQRDVAEIVAKNELALMMIKNQPWRERQHWVGIVDHVT
ncbi:MAG: hypothetical protein QW303_07410 [Nitrososphaerota archaeon]